MKKYLKFIYIIFISIFSFFTFENNAKAAELANCTNDKLLDCYYPVEVGKDSILSSKRKYLVECYFDLNKKFQCTIQCKENCSTYGYYLKQALEESRFYSSNKYLCPSSLMYRTVYNSSDDIYFEKVITEDSLYKYDQKTELDVAASCVKANAISTKYDCGYYGDNAYSFTISSTKEENGNFTYSAVYYSASPKDNFEISNINEVVKSKKVDSNGCPEKPFKLFSIVPDKVGTDGKMTYMIELTGPDGEEGQIEFGDYSGWESGKQTLISGPADKKSHITINNIFNVVTNKITCTGALSNTLPILKDIFKYVRVAAILLFLVLTSFDYVKAIADSDQSAFQKANKRVVTRVLVLIAVLILPAIMNLIFAIVQLSNGSCGIN